ncbi:YbaB/EbfC family nucleoid-associated protein [Streptosporangium sp. NPDC048865]|uniref:YbaB/EbfC family nucleoid-associated protein n=1 Tax=Streptosporangium sp. NPDC048865 TaxID=3155766 RepID=UPI00341A86B7
MTSPADPFAAAGDQELDRLFRDFQRDLTALEGLRDRIDSVEGRGEAADGRVVVNVTQTGMLVGLTIDPRALRLGSDRLAAAIVEAAARAARDAEQEASDLVAPFVAGTLLDGDRTDEARPR